jgi:glycosyltransferase involved in cell wall biosynthesis
MLSLVIPVYKNAENIPRLFTELERFAAGFADPLEIVFVVDGSPDASMRLLQERLPGWPVASQLVELSRNFGSFAAIVAGLSVARGDTMAVISADLQEPLELIAAFHAQMRAGDADVVFGHRTGRADPASSNMFSDLFWRLYRRFAVPDMPAGGIDMFGCTRQVRDQVVAMREVNTNLIALLFWLGFRRGFVPYERRARLEGRSAWTFGRKLRYALDSIFAFTDLPLRALLIIGAAGTTLAVVAALTVFIGWLAGRIPVLGYTPLMLVITFFGGLTALGLGITGEYLWLTLQNTRGRPNFIIRSSAAYGATGAASQRPTSARNSS